MSTLIGGLIPLAFMLTILAVMVGPAIIYTVHFAPRRDPRTPTATGVRGPTSEEAK